MIGIVLITHTGLGKEILQVMKHVAGPQPNIEYVGIYPDDDIEEKRHEVFEKTDSVDTGDGVVILTDIYGGTPSNLAISLMEERNVEVISGVNVPLLVKLVKVRNEPLKEAAHQAKEAGRNYIRVASELLKLDT